MPTPEPRALQRLESALRDLATCAKLGDVGQIGAAVVAVHFHLRPTGRAVGGWSIGVCAAIETAKRIQERLVGALGLRAFLDGRVNTAAMRPCRFRDGDFDKLQHCADVLRSALDGRTNRGAAEVPQYVTLAQCEGISRRKKRTLQADNTAGKLPAPNVRGGGGKPNQWLWTNIRPALEKLTGRSLPVRYPDAL